MKHARMDNPSKTRAAAALLIATWLVLALIPAKADAWRRAGGGGDVKVDANGDLIALEGGVRKYDGATGAALWTQAISGLYGDAYFLASAIDGAGDILVAGSVPNDFNNHDFIVAKLDGTDGHEIWRHEEDSGVDLPGSPLDAAQEIAVDANGDVIAAGIHNATSTGAIVKLAGANGAEIWRQDSASERGYTSIALDAAGNAVTGVVGTAGSFIVVKHSATTGAAVWTYSSSFPGVTDGFVYAVAVNASGDVVAAGAINDATAGYFAVAQIDGASGTEDWFTTASNSASHVANRALDVAIDTSGDVIAVGQLAQPTFDILEATVMKLAGGSGTEIWRHVLGEPDPSDEPETPGVARQLEIYDGALFVVGDRTSLLAAKLDAASGAEVWRQEVRSSLGTTAFGSTLAVDSNGDMIASGYLDTASALVKFSGIDGAMGPMPGKKLLVRDDNVDPTKRKIVFLAKDAQVAKPLAETPSDPTTNGAVVTIVNPTSGESVSYSLPAGSNWHALGKPAGAIGYAYRDPKAANGPCASLLVKDDKIRLTCTGKHSALGFTLDEPSQGSLIASVRFGSSSPQCTTFGGSIKRDSSTILEPKPTFLAKNAPATLGDCPAP